MQALPQTDADILANLIFTNCWKIRDLKSIDNFVKELKENLL